MYEERIWRFLKGKLLSDCGAAGLMGNLYAESGLNPVNLQNTHERKLGLSDKEYTQQVDFGLYADFVHDGAGYGLAQWTFWSRKQNLLVEGADGKLRLPGADAAECQFCPGRFRRGPAPV